MSGRRTRRPTTCSRSLAVLDSEVVYGRDRLRDLKEWDWGHRLVAVGIQRLEFERKVSRDEFESFLQEILARLTLSVITTSENRQMRPLGIRFGAVGVQVSRSRKRRRRHPLSPH